MSFLPAKLNDTREVRHGRKAGISPLAATALVFLMLLLMLVPTYHLGNSIGAHLAPHGGYVLVIIFLVAFAVATGEVILSILNYYKEKKTDAIDIPGRRGIMLVVILTTLTGAYSFHVDTAQESIQSDSHSQQSTTFNLRASALKSQWQADMTEVKTSAEQSRLTARYNRDRAALSSQLATHKAGAIVQTGEAAKIVLTFLYGVFSFVCSMVLVAYSRFFVTYAKQLVELPIIAYLDKLRLDWLEGKAQGSDVIIDAGTGKKKVMRDDDIATPPIEFYGTTYHAKNDNEESADNRPTPNRPEPTTTGMGAVLGATDTGGVRMPNGETKEGAFRAINVSDIAEAKRAVIAGDLSPTIKPIKQWLLESRQVGISDIERQNTAKKLLDGMAKEGILILNPAQADTKQMLAKYVLTSSVNSEQSDSDFSEEDAYWAGIIAKLEAGEHVPDLGGENGNKPQGWIDYEERQFIKMMNSSSTEKVKGGTIHQQGGFMSFTPDWLGDPNHPDRPENKIRQGSDILNLICPACGDTPSIQISDLSPKHDNVRCGECSTAFGAYDNQAKEGTGDAT